MLFVLTPYLITQFTGNINNFNVIYLLTRGEPLGVGNSVGDTDLLVTWLYKLSVDQQKYNLAAVIGIVTFIVLAAVTLYCYRRYEEKSLQNVLMKGIVTAAAFAWGVMLNVQDSFAVILLVCVLWGFRKNPLYRNFAGAAAVVACTLVSLFYLASPMGFPAIHFYNKEPGEGSRIAGDLAHPVILLLFGVAAKFL